MAKENFADLDELNSWANSNEEEEGNEIDFITLFLVARKSIIWIILLILLGLGASYLFIRYTKPVFKSSSTIKIDEQSHAGVLGLEGPLGDAADNNQNIISLSGEVELIKSNIIYQDLKEKLNLEVNYYAIGNVLNEELYNNSPFHVVYEIRDDNFYNKQFNVKFLDTKRYRLSYLIGEQEFSEIHTLGERINKKEINFELLANPNFNEEVLERSFFFGYIDNAG